MQIHGMRFIFSFQIIVPFEILNKRQFSVTSHNPRLFPGIKGVTYQEIIWPQVTVTSTSTSHLT